MSRHAHAPPQTGKGTRKGKRGKAEDVEEMMRAVSHAAHVARDKGFYTVSREAITCVRLLRHIKHLRVSPSLILGYSFIDNVRFLTTNGNPVIKSEARSLLHHWRTILSVSSQRKKSIRKTELNELCDVLKKAAQAVNFRVYSYEDSKRWVETMELLLRVPRDLARDAVDATDIRSSLAFLAEHGRADVRSTARSLVDSWRTIRYSNGTEDRKNSE